MNRTILFMILFCLVFASGAPARQALPPGDHERSFEFGKITRTYLVHVPPGFSHEKKTPVVLAFHGGANNALVMSQTTDLNGVADKEGFLVVYPNGTGNLKRVFTWNAGNCCAYAQRKKIDDVGMTRALIEDLGKVAVVDDKRVFATGMSNGGMMAMRLACELSDQIAAVAPVAGGLELEPCKPSRPVPILYIHGTADKNVDYKGGYGVNSIAKIDFNSVADTVSTWRDNNGCSLESTEENLPDIAQDKTTTRRTLWNKCKSNAEIVLYTVEGGGHAWPGSPLRRWGRFGPVSQDFSAGQVMWEFFSRHPLP